MSGHITRMSRGSSVSSSASRPSSTSRSTSTWRAGPWQLCTCTERSSARSERPCGAQRHWRRYRTAASPAGCPGGRAPGRNSSVAAVGGQAALQLAQIASEGGQQGVADARGGCRRRGAGSTPRRPASALHSPALGCGSHRCSSWWVGQGVEQFDVGGRQPGVAEQRQPRAAGRRPTPAAAQRFSRAGYAAGRWPSASTSRRHSSGCQARSSARSPVVAVQPVRPAARGRCRA